MATLQLLTLALCADDLEFDVGLAAGTDVTLEHGLVRLVLLDRWGSAVTTDSRSSCFVTGVNNVTGAFVSLFYAPVYAVVGGVASVKPFRIDLSAGSVVIVTVSCASGTLKVRFVTLIRWLCDRVDSAAGPP